MRTITTYHKDGTKTESTYVPPTVTYDATIDKPLHQRVLDGYYALECQGRLRESDMREFGGARRVAELHKRALDRVIR
jgi:hypothetical protein